MAATVEMSFEVIHKKIDGKHTLTFKPAIKKGGHYKPKIIEISAEQWDELRFNFCTGINDETGETILGYVI